MATGLSLFVLIRVTDLIEDGKGGCLVEPNDVEVFTTVIEYK